MHQLQRFMALAASLQLFAIASVLPRSAVAAEEAASWRWQDPAAGVKITLRQRQPDAVRAFFIARGFSSTDADAIASQCIFLVGITNTAEHAEAGALDIDLSEWRVNPGNGPQPLRLKERWLQHWEQAGAPETARTAFYWSMYHSQQHLEPGERMFGMLSMGLPADSRFQLNFSWRRSETTGQGGLVDLQCAPDPSKPNRKE